MKTTVIIIENLSNRIDINFLKEAIESNLEFQQSFNKLDELDNTFLNEISKNKWLDFRILNKHFQGSTIENIKAIVGLYCEEKNCQFQFSHKRTELSDTGVYVTLPHFIIIT